jgi:RNA polymerase sigma factor (sigma-70 family)
MYVLHPHSHLTPFYAVYVQNQWRLNPGNLVQNQWRLNPENLIYIAQICSNYLPEPPIDRHLATVDRYINEQLASNPNLANLVVTELYQKFSTDGNHRIWINFIHYISTILVSRLWNQLPVYKRTNEKLELFQNAALLSPAKLFTNFDPEYDRDLLTGIERWTYRSLRNVIYGQIRDREDPLFGLKDLGVVAKKTPSYLHSVRSRYVSKDRLVLDTFLVQIFKNYLKRSRVRTNLLQLNDWEEIHREVEQQWHNLTLNSPPPSIEKIKQALDAIGDCVRKDSEMKPIDSLDRGLNSEGEQTLAATIKPIDRDLEDREDWGERYQQFLTVVKAAIAKLDLIDREILQLHYQTKLTQQEIGEKLGEDQSSTSRKMRNIHRYLIKEIHQQIDNPNHSALKIDKTSIDAMKQSLKIFYQN